jgi:amidase
MSATTTATELWRMSALKLAEAIRCREASSREVVEAHLRRIEDVNPSINAVVVVLGEQAVEAADTADRQIAAGGDLPPLHGVPFTVKENIDLGGTPTTWGARALADAYPTRDAPVVERLRSAGAIPIGRTNMPAFAVRWHCDSELRGSTVNPWDRSRTPGGSSGGDAVALATGMTPLGFGNDTLGSLRVPAQFCGVGALKPTLGRIPHATTAGLSDGPISNQLMGVQGPMARRVSDLRVALAAVAGPTWRDPWSVPAPLRGPEPAKPIPVALVVDPGGAGTSKQVQDGIRKAAAALEDSGYIVEEIEPPSIAAAAKLAVDMLCNDLRVAWPIITPPMPAETKQFLSAMLQVAGEADPLAAVMTFMTRQSLLRSWGEFQETYPLIVAPICTDIPFEAGTDLDEGRVAETIRGMRMTLTANALGLPAVAVPVGVGDGLPQVIQIIGPRYREDLCLDAAQAIEDRVGILTPIEPRQQAEVRP